jgi:hypothetical protein
VQFVCEAYAFLIQLAHHGLHQRFGHEQCYQVPGARVGVLSGLANSCAKESNTDLGRVFTWGIAPKRRTRGAWAAMTSQYSPPLIQRYSPETLRKDREFTVFDTLTHPVKILSPGQWECSLKASWGSPSRKPTRILGGFPSGVAAESYDSRYFAKTKNHQQGAGGGAI